jgi:chlorophyllide a reductase subunit Y
VIAPGGSVTLPVLDPSTDDASCGTGCGCHGGAERLMAADGAQRSEVLERLREDYPLGPHDQPQGMCPAFGSLRVGLRMRRTATVLSGSACCVYGLTFTSHFYGARRTVGYVPFNSETLVTGQLYEDIKKALEELADPERYDTIVMTNLCIPTASGVPLDRLPTQINGVRIIGIDVPGFGVPTHAEAKDVLTGALLKYARSEAEQGPVARPDDLVLDRPTVTLIGELFPADPIGIQQLLDPMGVAVGSTVPAREWRELYKALDCTAAAAIHPFYVSAVRQFDQAGRPVVGSAPVGVDGTADWLRAIAEATGVSSQDSDTAVDRATAATRAALDRFRLNGRISLSGYEGSELLVARVLIESGAEVPYVGTALPRTRWSGPDVEWLAAHGCHVQFRASLEHDIAAFQDVNPDLVVGTTPVVQKAKEAGIPGLYFTNLISARPIFGVAGAGSLSSTIQGALASREPLQRMRAFFEGVGTGHATGYGWRDVPRKRLTAKERHAAARKKKTSKSNSAKTETETMNRVARSAQAKGSFQPSASDDSAAGEGGA